MAEITVNTLVDENDGIETGGVSLREAIDAAASGDQILFDSSLANGTIILTNGELVIAESLTINGDTDGNPETRNITIDADGNSRVFRVDDENIDTSQTITLNELTITGGVFTFVFPSVFTNTGAGIYNKENLTLTNSTISGNSAANGTGGIHNSFRAIINISNSVLSDNISDMSGSFIYSSGGIFNSGTATISNSTISGNTSIGSGSYGGAGVFNAGLATISDSIINNNSTSSSGGGIHNGGFSYSNLIVTNSTITGNTASRGGGIYNGGFGSSSVSISNSTISGNSARYGGGIRSSFGSLDISNSTISANTAVRDGGGIHNNSSEVDISNSTISANTAVRYGGGVFNSYNSTANIISTIVATNTAQDNPDVDGNFIDQGHNLIGDTTGSSSFITSTLVGDTENPIDPLLGPLTDNGGPTPTQALLVGSPAIETGSNPLGLITDQRGDSFVREFLGQRADIGAFEFQPDDLPVPLDDPSDLENTAFTTNENTGFTTENVLTNDIDPLNNGLSITSFDTTTTQGIVTNNSDGTFDYNPDGQFEFLAQGEIATDTFTYTVEDSAGNPGIAPAIVNITIEGINDAPTVSNAIADQTAFPLNIFSFVVPFDTFSDIDNGDILSFNALDLPDWLIFDPIMVTFNGVPTNADAGSSNIITVRATDSFGENVTNDFTLTVEGTVTPPVMPAVTPTVTPTTTSPLPSIPSTPTPMIIVPPSSLRVDPSSQIPDIEEPDIAENRNATETIEVTSSLTPTIGTDGIDNIFGNHAANIIFGQRNSDFIRGENSSDTIHGGQGNDEILGGLGNDSIFGNLGNDTILGGEGSDWINGNQGDDFISSEAGLDTVFGGQNNDTLVGGDGFDQMYGNRGEDLIAGSRGNDSLYGGKAADTVSGNEGNDFVSGDDGSDLLDGNEGQDTLLGGAGNDVIDGGENNDNLDGGEGNDELIGAGGSDTIRGGEDNDRFVLSPGDGTDTILDFQNGIDFLVLDGGLTFDDLVLIQDSSNVQLLFNSEILAVLNGVNIGDITVNNFTSTL